MNPTRRWLTMAAAVCIALPSFSAPAPAPIPNSQGPITDALRMRALLPRTAPLTACPAVVVADGQIELERRSAVPIVTYVKEAVKTADGRVTEVTRAATMTEARVTKSRVAVKACKFFVVSKDGKLEPIDPEKATALLKKTTAVLTGDNADVDPRTFELIKPGTLCLIFQPPPPTPPPPLPDEKPRN
jgi:hypothetical protein